MQFSTLASSWALSPADRKAYLKAIEKDEREARARGSQQVPSNCRPK